MPPTLDTPAILTLVLAIVSCINADPSNEYTFTLTSWWRSTQRNQEVGGVPNSLHVKGQAIDVSVASNSTIKNVLQFGQAAGIGATAVAIAWRKFGFQALVESDHVHLELDPIR